MGTGAVGPGGVDVGCAERLRVTIDSMLDAHAVLEALRDDGGRIYDFIFLDGNRAAAEARGFTPDALIGSRLLGEHPTPGDTALLGLYASVVETGEPLALTEWLYPTEPADAPALYLDMRALRLGDGLVVTSRDVTDRVLAVQGAAPARAAADTHSAMLFCSVDRLEWIAEHFGPEAGDGVLGTMAERISAALRTSDVVGRMGGGEFMIVLNGIHTIQEALKVGEKVRGAVRAPIAVPPSTHHPSLSVAVAMATSEESVEVLLERADQALEQARLAGGNRVVPIPHE